MLIYAPVDERCDVKPAAGVAAEHADSAELHTLAICVHARAGYAGARRIADANAALDSRHHAKIAIVANKALHEASCAQRLLQSRRLLRVIRARKAEHRIRDLLDGVSLRLQQLFGFADEHIRRCVIAAGQYFMIAWATSARGNHRAGRVE